MCGEQSDGETAWWSEIWQIFEWNWILKYQWEKWCEESQRTEREILTFDGPKHRANTGPTQGRDGASTGPHMDHLLLLEMKLSRNLKEIQEKWRWILREIREKSRWLTLRLWWYFVYFILSIFINKLYFNSSMFINIVQRVPRFQGQRQNYRLRHIFSWASPFSPLCHVKSKHAC